MPQTRNWKALSIPSIEGKKTQLNVSGESQTGVVALKLTKREDKVPANVYALNLEGIGGGEFGRVNYQADVPNTNKLDVVLIYNEKNQIEAAVLVEQVQSF